MTDTEEELGESIALEVETSRRGARRRLLGSVAAMPPWVGGLIGVVVIIVLWWIVSAVFFGSDGAIPLPSKVAVELYKDLTSSIFWDAIADTSKAAAWGFLWGNVIAFFLAFLVLLLPWFEGLATQLAVVCSCIPITAIGPIITIMSPLGSHAPAIFLAAISVIFTTVIGSLLGLKAASQTQLDVIRAYGGGRLRQLFSVRLIAAVPSIFAALKIAAPAAFLGSVLGEYFLLNVQSGLGVLILVSQANNNSVRIWALALICGGIAGIAYWLIGLIGRLASPWSSGQMR